MKVIGTANGRAVYWNEHTMAITIYGTSIMITGAFNKEEAIAICERNLNDFKAAKGREI